MNNIRKKLLEEIDNKISRKKKLRQEIAKRKDDVEAFVLNLMEEVDDMMAKTVNTSLHQVLIPTYIRSLENDIRSLDPKAKIEVSWHTSTEQGVPNRINGILIKWSSDYQIKNDCEAERYIDTLSLLLK